jgi:beta-glucanase (GH16 family)
MIQIPVTNPQNQWHTYTFNWTSAAITYLVDGVAVRTLKYEDAKGGSRFPQTPMRLRLGIWAGGDPSLPQGTIDWAGGLTDYSKAPFAMYIDSTTITNYSPADKYHYKDNSGDWKSIDVIGGTTGGIVSPGQQSVQDIAVSSSTAGQSTASSAIPDVAIATAPASSYSNSTVSTSATSSVSAAATKTSTSASTSAAASSSASASKSNASAAKATNAASGLSGMWEIAGLSILSVLSLIFFG